jgi:hypothetical protein
MKKVVLWASLVASASTAAGLAIVHFKVSPSTFRRFVRPGPLSAGHAYLADRCETCHEPIVGVTVTKCTSCHAASARLLGRQPTAFHASVQECAACHVEHEPADVRPLVFDHVELARIGARTLARSGGAERDSAATWRSLQAWLRVDRPAAFDDRSAKEALNCAGCHDRRDPHFKRFGADCAQCHSFQSWTVAGYQHPSPRSRECVQCHQPPPSHFMGHFSMVSRQAARKEHARVEDCFECHNTTAWNDIVDVGFYKHH